MVNKSSNFILHGFSYFTILIKLARFLNNVVFCWNQKQCYMRPCCTNFFKEVKNVRLTEKDMKTVVPCWTRRSSKKSLEAALKQVLFNFFMPMPSACRIFFSLAKKNFAHKKLIFGDKKYIFTTYANAICSTIFFLPSKKNFADEKLNFAGEKYIFTT